jgi:hypothetical protein
MAGMTTPRWAALQTAVARAEDSLWTQRFLPLGQVGAKKAEKFLDSGGC